VASDESRDIPRAVRQECYDRDGGCCRVCGKFLGERYTIHHIEFGGGSGPGMGGRRVHDPAKMVGICSWPGDPTYKAKPCHDVVHSEKRVWQPILRMAVQRPGITAFQLRRWLRAADHASAGSAQGNDDR